MPAAERHDPKKLGLRSESETFKLQGFDPNYVYERKSLDEKHPNYVGNYLRPHEIGNGSVGYTTVASWEVVERKDSNHPVLKKRADEGKDLDTTVQRGGQVLVRLHKDEHAKYKLIDKLNDDARAKMLRTDRQSFGRGSVMRGGVDSGTMADEAANADYRDIIKGS